MSYRRFLAVLLPLPLLVALGGAQADAADTLLSQRQPVLASSIEDDTLPAALAVDGSTTTRWASAEGADPQWIRVDLGQPASIRRVKLNWEVAYAKAYRIEVSDNGTDFRTVKTVADVNGATDDLTGLTAHGRYVRLVGTQRATPYGYSLWELEVYGTADSTGDTQPPTVPTGLQRTLAAANVHRRVSAQRRSASIIRPAARQRLEARHSVTPPSDCPTQPRLQ